MGNTHSVLQAEGLFEGQQCKKTTVAFCKELAQKYQYKWTVDLDDWVEDVESEPGSQVLPVAKAIKKAQRLISEIAKQRSEHQQTKETVTMLGSNIFTSAMRNPGVNALASLPPEWRDYIVPKLDPEGSVRERRVAAGGLAGGLVGRLAGISRPRACPDEATNTHRLPGALPLSLRFALDAPHPSLTPPPSLR